MSLPTFSSAEIFWCTAPQAVTPQRTVVGSQEHIVVAPSAEHALRDVQQLWQVYTVHVRSQQHVAGILEKLKHVPLPQQVQTPKHYWLTRWFGAQAPTSSAPGMERFYVFGAMPGMDVCERLVVAKDAQSACQQVRGARVPWVVTGAWSQRQLSQAWLNMEAVRTGKAQALHVHAAPTQEYTYVPSARSHERARQTDAW